MTQTVTMPDGSAHVFPDEATPEMIAGALGVTHEPPANGNAVPSSPSVMKTIGHEAGVAGRAMASGAANIVDTAVMAANPALDTFNRIKRMAGDSKKTAPSIEDMANRGMDAAGVPKPESTAERIASDAIAGGTSSLAFGPVGAISGVTGGAASGLAREGGFGPVTQIIAGLIGGMSPVNAANAMAALTKGGYRVAKDFMNPANAENIGKILVEHADNPEAVVAKLKTAAPEFVPGSKPTLGEVAGDNGLIAAQASAERTRPEMLAPVRQANTAARNQSMDAMANTPEALAQARKKRSTVTGPMYDTAHGDLVDPKAIKPVLDQIDAAIEGVGAHTDAGKVLTGLKSDIQKSLPKMKQNVSPILDADGNRISNPVFTNATQGPLVQVYKEARDNANKTAMQEGAYSATVKSVVKPIIHDLGTAMEGQSANLKAANDKYKELSGPINQMEELQGIRESAQRNQPVDVNGNQAMKPSTINSALSEDGRVELSKVLTKDQMERLDGIQKDMARQSTMQSVKPAGSNTSADLTANVALNKIIGTVISHHLDKIPVVGKMLAGARSGAVERGVANAYANPEEAKAAMTAALKALQKETIPAQMKRVALQSLLGSSIGALSPKDAMTIRGTQ